MSRYHREFKTKQNKKKHHVAFSVAFSVEESSVILVMTILIFHH